jgi:hypothetical protein
MLRVPTPRCWCLGQGNRRRGLKGALIQRVRGDAVGKVGFRRQWEIKGAQTERSQHRLVDHIIARLDGPECNAKRQIPRKQRLTRGNGLDGKAMPFHDCMVEAEMPLPIADLSARLQAAGGNGDIVAGQRQTADVVQGNLFHLFCL